MIDINNFDAIKIGLASVEADPVLVARARSPSRRPSTTGRSSPRRTVSSASASSVPPRTGSATAASTSASATRASSASAAASRSRAPRCAASAWGTSTWRPRSRTSGSSRACRRASATCSTWRPRSSRRSSTSRLRSSPGSTTRRARRTSAKLEKEVQKTIDSYDAEREERVLELRESLERRARVPQDRQADRLHRRRPPLGGLARRQPQEAVRRRPREDGEGDPQAVRRGHLRHRGLHRGRRRADAPGLGPVPGRWSPRT